MQEPLIQTPPEQPAATKPNRTWLIAGIMIAIALLIILGFYIWGKNLRKHTEEAIQYGLEAQQKAEQHRNEISANSTTYKNDRYGFEFSYPKDWEIKPTTQEQGASVAQSDKEVFAVSVVDPKTLTSGYPISMNFRVFDFPDLTTYRTWLKGAYTGPDGQTFVQPASTAPQTLGGQAATRSDVFGGDQLGVHIATVNNGKVYELSFSDPGPNDEPNTAHQEQYTNILGSFKFDR